MGDQPAERQFKDDLPLDQVGDDRTQCQPGNDAADGLDQEERGIAAVPDGPQSQPAGYDEQEYKQLGMTFGRSSAESSVNMSARKKANR